jgi:gluconolactonase
VACTPDHFDSLAVEADGTVVVAAIGHGLCLVRPDGAIEHVPMPDHMTTNVCFGGPDLRTAYVTLSAGGRLVSLDWPRSGLRLAH